jgi:hypothetical protein
MAIDENAVKRGAIDHPDLKPLWDSMSGTIWKRMEQPAQAVAMSRLVLTRFLASTCPHAKPM